MLPKLIGMLGITRHKIVRSRLIKVDREVKGGNMARKSKRCEL